MLMSRDPEVQEGALIKTAALISPLYKTNTRQTQILREKTIRLKSHVLDQNPFKFILIHTTPLLQFRRLWPQPYNHL